MRVYTWLTLTAVLCFLSACSTANRGATLLPERIASGGFAVTALEGQGTYTPQWSVSDDEAGALLTVTAAGAEELSAAFVHVHYDAARYTPDSVEVGDFLGDEGQVISLALTDVADVVPVGIVQIASARVSPREGGGVLARVRFRAGPFLAPRAASCSPCGEYNAVDDLKSVEDGEAGTAMLSWTEKNLGDYNNDCLVGIQDLTPLGVYFGMWVSDTQDPLRAMLADGNGDGMINLTDITQIGQNYGSKLSGYYAYTDAAGTKKYGEGINVLRGDMVSDPLNPDPSHPIKYRLEVSLPPSGEVEFTVAPVDDADAQNPGPVSNVAVVRAPGEPPEPPTMFTALSDESTGHQTVQLSWEASVSEFVASYVLERQLDSEGLWSEIVEVPATQTGYADHDETFIEGESYTYRIYAEDDLGQSSGYELSAPVVPYFATAPEPPSGVTAVSDEGTGHKTVELSWAASPSTSVTFYVIERQRDSEGVWGPVTEVPAAQTACTDYDESFIPGESYSYRVCARDDVPLYSGFASSNSVVPYFTVTPDPPWNLVADNDLPLLNAIEVSWNAPFNDNNVAKYNVYRKAPGEEQFSLLASTPDKETTSHQDTGLIPGGYYEYYATAEAPGGAESAPSNADGCTPSVEVLIQITDLTTDKTTHCYDASEPASNLEVFTDVPPDSVDWVASAGVITPSGTTATWLPTAGMDPVKVTVNCTVHRGTDQDTDTIDLYVTRETIKSQYGDNGQYLDFDLECLEALAISGDILPSRSFSYYADGEHVVIFDRWERT